MQIVSLIPFAYSNASKKLVDVNEVPRGLACDCKCPSCNMRLQARQGEVNEHHFSHYDKAESECMYSYWVSVRDMTKQILREVKYLKIKQHNTSNLQSIPYRLASLVVEIFHTSKKNNNFDLVLQTSIGELNISLLTPEISRLDYVHPKEGFFDKLVLQINLEGMITGSALSKKEQLRKLIIEDLKSKRFLCSFFEFFEEDEEEIEETIETRSSYSTMKNKPGPTTTEEIARCLYLDARSLNYRQIDAIGRMEEFFTTCTKKHFEALFPQEYTVCYTELGFEYISYENEFYALANIDGIYVMYRFENFFEKVFSTRDYKNVYQLLKRVHSDAENAF